MSLEKGLLAWTKEGVNMLGEKGKGRVCCFNGASRMTLFKAVC